MARESELKQAMNKIMDIVREHNLAAQVILGNEFKTAFGFTIETSWTLAKTVEPEQGRYKILIHAPQDFGDDFDGWQKTTRTTLGFLADLQRINDEQANDLSHSIKEVVKDLNRHINTGD